MQYSTTIEQNLLRMRDMISLNNSKLWIKFFDKRQRKIQVVHWMYSGSVLLQTWQSNVITMTRTRMSSNSNPNGHLRHCKKYDLNLLSILTAHKLGLVWIFMQKNFSYLGVKFMSQSAFQNTKNKRKNMALLQHAHYPSTRAGTKGVVADSTIVSRELWMTLVFGVKTLLVRDTLQLLHVLQQNNYLKNWDHLSNSMESESIVNCALDLAEDKGGKSKGCLPKDLAGIQVLADPSYHRSTWHNCFYKLAKKRKRKSQIWRMIGQKKWG